MAGKKDTIIQFIIGAVLLAATTFNIFAPNGTIGELFNKAKGQISLPTTTNNIAKKLLDNPNIPAYQISEYTPKPDTVSNVPHNGKHHAPSPK